MQVFQRGKDADRSRPPLHGEIAAYKNSTNTNLLIMDEVFDSSLDGFGTEDFLKIIRFVIMASTFLLSLTKKGCSTNSKVSYALRRSKVSPV